jgi:hypothetical protein
MKTILASKLALALCVCPPVAIVAYHVAPTHIQKSIKHNVAKKLKQVSENIEKEETSPKQTQAPCFNYNTDNIANYSYKFDNFEAPPKLQIFSENRNFPIFFNRDDSNVINQWSGTHPPGIPEPETWMQLIAGFTLTGFVLRQTTKGKQNEENISNNS